MFRRAVAVGGEIGDAPGFLGVFSGLPFGFMGMGQWRRRTAICAFVSRELIRERERYRLTHGRRSLCRGAQATA